MSIMDYEDYKNLQNNIDNDTQAGVYSKQNINKFTKHLSHKFMSYMYDTDYRVNYVTDGIKYIFGILPKEMIGSCFYEKVHWQQSELKKIRTLEEKLQKDTKRSKQIDTSFVDTNGNIKHIRMTKYAIVIENKITGYEGIIEDITKEKEHELEEKRLLKELSCLNELTNTINMFHNIDELLKNSTRVISNGCCFPKSTMTKIIFDSKEYVDIFVEDALCENTSDIVIDSKKRGYVTTYTKCLSDICIKNTYTNKIKFLDIATEQLGVALNNLILKQHLEDMANHDSLTRLYNRNVIKKEIKNELTKAKRHNRNLSVILIDADYFKSINDTFGHQTGDTVLVELSKLFSKAIRSSDYAIRYGGEEFALVLPEASINTALEISLRIKEKVKNNQFNIDKNKINMTVSIGISSFPEHSDNLEELFKMADEALYEAKDSGRDAVYIYS